MADVRSRIDKLRAMAAQTSSPEEAETARKMLAELKVPITEPPKEPKRTCVFFGCTRPPVLDSRGLRWTCAYHRDGAGLSPPTHEVPEPVVQAPFADAVRRATREGRYAEAVDLSGRKAPDGRGWIRHMGGIRVNVEDPFGDD